MGEEDLEKKVGPNGYNLEPQRLKEAIAQADSSAVVTVGKIWKLAENDALLRRDPRLKKLCLSFTLYKLLRRRLEDLPITDAETRYSHNIVFRGLCKEEGMDDDDDDDRAGAAATALFEVFNDEVLFLCEYYHSVFPVMLASTFFFLVNYILFPILVWAFCSLTIILCSHGDLVYALHSFRADNYAVTVGLLRTILGCVLTKMASSRQYLFSTIDIPITILLLLACVYEEVWEFIVFLLSNWFMVSLICSCASKPQRRTSTFLSGVIRRILCVRNALSQTKVCFKQFSVMWLCRLPTKTVPLEAKKTIMERLANVSDVAPLSNGMSTLQSGAGEGELSWACESASIAEVILTWHIATELLEAKHPLPKETRPGASADRKVAMALSRYCAYLVAFHPELLPDDKDCTERVCQEMEEELKKEMRCFLWYHCSGVSARIRKLMEIVPGPEEKEATTALRKGAKLGKILIDKHEADADQVWKLLARLWTEVLAYAAPTSSELHVKAHKEALALGGEFITVVGVDHPHRYSPRAGGDAACGCLALAPAGRPVGLFVCS